MLLHLLEFKSTATLVKEPSGSPSTSWDFKPRYVSFNYLFHYSLKSPTREEDDKSLLVVVAVFYFFVSNILRIQIHSLIGIISNENTA